MKTRIRTNTLRVVSILLIVTLINLTIGCRNYFLVNTVKEPTVEKLASLYEAYKTIIVHFNDKKWVLTDIMIKNNTVTGKWEPYRMPPTLYKVKPDRPNRYLIREPKNQRYLLNEVHLYISEYTDLGNNLIAIPASSILKLEIYDPDTASTVGSWILGTGITTAAASYLAFLVIILTKESCPFIYVWNGNTYDFQGEIYSGSIHKQLERNDYLKLPPPTETNSYTLKITNEIKEIQHTNLMELMVIDHPQNTQVLADKYGVISSIEKPLEPLMATSETGANVTNLLLAEDSLFYQSNPPKDKKPLKDFLILDFPTSKNTKEAKLVIHAKTSVFLDYMISKHIESFGSGYEAYLKDQEKKDAADMKQWSKDQGLPLSVYVQRTGNWEFVDFYNIVGPMAFKWDVLKIPLQGNESNPLKLKLEFGAFFWEIDYAAVDYSTDQKLAKTNVPIKKAVTEDMINVTKLLKMDDAEYYTQPAMTNQAVVTFDLPKQTNQRRTVILHSKGWYEYLQNPEGKMDVARLTKNRVPGGFNQFVNETIESMERRVAMP